MATPLVVTITVAVQMLYVEDVLGDPMEVLGHAEEEALNERAGGKWSRRLSLRRLLNFNAARRVEKVLSS